MPFKPRLNEAQKRRRRRREEARLLVHCKSIQVHFCPNVHLEVLGVDAQFADPAADRAQLNHAPIRRRAHVKARSGVQVHDRGAVCRVKKRVELR